MTIKEKVINQITDLSLRFEKDDPAPFVDFREVGFYRTNLKRQVYSRSI